MSANGTRFDFDFSGRGKAPETLLVPLVAKPAPAFEMLTRVDRLCGDAVSTLLEAVSVPDEVGGISHTAASGTFRRVLIVSLGDAERLDAARVRSAAAAAARWIISEKLPRVAVWIGGLALPEQDALAEWTIGMALAGFRFTELRTEEKKAPPRVQVDLLDDAGAGAPPAAARRGRSAAQKGAATRRAAADGLQRRVEHALVEADAVNYCRRIAHLPANVIHPGTLAEEARRAARDVGLKCTVMGPADLKRMKMGGLLAVGRGAETPPCLIQLEHRGNPRARGVHVLVGKAITFDTGGYSIKTNEGMLTMKFDKCGGCAVLATMWAVARLGLPCNVVGLIAAAENMISAEAYRPGDILTMMSGKTVEIISTDAEGRLVLADALWYAQEQFEPASLIDLATLTGGVRTALGTAAAGLMSNDDALAGQLGEAGRRVHERLWRLPLWDDYRELIKAQDCDIKNSAGKPEAHAIVGGMFLKEFLKPGIAWAHLDIASVATRDDAKLPTGKGATGFGVRLLLEFLRRHAV